MVHKYNLSKLHTCIINFDFTLGVAVALYYFTIKCLPKQSKQIQ